MAAAQISAARKAAYRLLLTVDAGKAHSDDLLRGKAVSALVPPDRHLATALVLGVLRWQIRLDHELKALLTRPNAKLDAEIRIALRMGAFQLLHMDRIPARAAIDESVELAKQAGHRFASGMVNAVLRKLAAQRPRDEKAAAGAPEPGSDHATSRTLAQGASAAGKATSFSPYNCTENLKWASAPEASSAAALALEFAHPAWLVERWAAVYGLEAARCICAHGQSQPALMLRLTNAEAEAELTAAGIVLGPAHLLTVARTVLAGDVIASDALRAGIVRMQDEGSQLVAEVAAQAGPGAERILDACAAPGGKTLILAERNPQAHIVACETSAPRHEQLVKRMAALGTRVECRLADASALDCEAEFDLTLVDVPCSGTGTLGRNPEIRHRLDIEDLPRQAERQRAILAAALRAVRPGGRVVYSTCSLELEENEQVVAAVVGADATARNVPLTASLDELLRRGVLTSEGAERLRGCLTREGYLRLLPGVAGTDGFFIALLERTGS